MSTVREIHQRQRGPAAPGLLVDIQFEGCGIMIDFVVGQRAEDLAKHLRQVALEIQQWARISPPESPLPLELPEVPAPDPGPTKAQQKAAWGFVAGTLRLAQANTRSGFDSRMLDAALVICQANERAV